MCHGAKRSGIFLVPSVVGFSQAVFSVAILFVMLFLFFYLRCFRLGLVLRNIGFLFFLGFGLLRKLELVLC
jgi:hypothetical protein